jgi:formamidopyrimidine-DNA glycosylase
VPELPEVETVRRNLERGLVGKSISSADVRLPKLLRDSPIPTLEPMVGRTVISVRRRAKVLLIDVDEGLSLLVHLKLAGQVAVFLPDGTRLVAGHPIPAPAGEYPHKTTHVEFRFADGTIAYFSDVRQFGWFRLMPTEEVQTALDAFGFGPEGTEVLSVNSLGVIMRRRGIPIKTLLLDQSFIAGLGNIYVDEVLFRSHVHPATPANALTLEQQTTILGNVPPVLHEGIRQGGAKIIHNKAHPVDEFPAVHGRGGEPCFVCGTTIEKIRVGGRGTYFCPVCQPL